MEVKNSSVGDLHTSSQCSVEDRAFELLREALPGLHEGQYRLIKETSHPYWEQAVDIASKEENK